MTQEQRRRLAEQMTGRHEEGLLDVPTPSWKRQRERSTDIISSCMESKNHNHNSCVQITYSDGYYCRGISFRNVLFNIIAFNRICNMFLLPCPLNKIIKTCQHTYTYLPTRTRSEHVRHLLFSYLFLCLLCNN